MLIPICPAGATDLQQCVLTPVNDVVSPGLTVNEALQVMPYFVEIIMLTAFICGVILIIKKAFN